MERDVYYERQRALIERSLLSQAEELERKETIRRYKHNMAASKAYYKVQHTKGYKMVRVGKGQRSIKRQHTSMEKCDRMVYRVKRFDNSYIHVYCKGR